MWAHDNDAVQSSRIYIVEEGPNPSTDYFVLPLFTRAQETVLRCNWDQLPAASDLHGAIVIFVRYVTAAWRALIEQTRHSLARLIYFMDDDLFDWKASQGLTWRARTQNSLIFTEQVRQAFTLRPARGSTLLKQANKACLCPCRYQVG